MLDVGREAEGRAARRQQQGSPRRALPAPPPDPAPPPPAAEEDHPDSGPRVLLYEANDGRREIRLDGRPLPANDPQPWGYGDSTGRWEGDTLVVESSGFKDQSWIDEWGTPGSDRLKLTERTAAPPSARWRFR